MPRMPAATTMLPAAPRPVSRRASVATDAASPTSPLARTQPVAPSTFTCTQPASHFNRSTFVPAGSTRTSATSA